MQEQGLHLEQKQRLRLSQQQLRYVRLLELNAPELDDAVERELADNPALEAIDNPQEEQNAESRERAAEDRNNSWAYLRNRSSSDFEQREWTPADDTENLYDYLDRQISERDLPTQEAAVARYLVGNMDGNGYIRRPIEKIVEDLDFNHGFHVQLDVARRALAVVQDLDPAGVGAIDLRECLELQLERMAPSPERDNALDIIRRCFTEFTMKHYHKIVSELGLSMQQTREAVELILTLNPKPGASYSSNAEDRSNVIIPDFIVENNDGRLSVTLNNRIPELAVEQSFSEAVAAMQRNREGRKARAKKGQEFIVSRYNDARDFIRILRQRQQTMTDVMTAILQLQKDYFLTEDVDRMRPMMIKDIAALTGLDLSTISRATANKFVGTPWGVFPLRHFFSDTVGGERSESEGLTNRRIESEIQRLVDAEDKKHPLSDQKLCEALVAKGYDVSRRTVAKYRDRKGIPVARLRRGM